MATDGSGSIQSEGAEALKLMEEALELLDRCDGAADIGAHLDLAICRLRALVAQPPFDSEAPSPRPLRP